MTQSNKLALLGGTRLVDDHERLRISWPEVTEEDRSAVISAFERMDFSGRGSSEVLNLETEMAEYFCMPYATALNSGTAALHAALFALGIGSGDEVVVPNLTFIATALAVLQSGAKPVFADVNTENYNIDAEGLVRALSSNTRAVIVVHMHGTPADLDPIIEICRRREIFLIEDVAQSPGARYKGRLLGSFGDASTFSLMSQKNLATCGECGVLLTKTELSKNRAEMLRIYGEIIREGEPRKYNSVTWGWNYTLNPIQAAMARTQLRRFSSLTSRVQACGRLLSERLSQFEWIQVPTDNEVFENVFHFYRVRLLPHPDWGIDPGRFRLGVQHALNAEGLNVRHYQNCPVSMQPVFRDAGAGLELPSPAEMRGTLEVIRTTLVLGAIGSSPAYLLKEGTIEAYWRGFCKISENLAALIDYCRRAPYKEPWQEIPVTSDSFRAQYATLNL